MLKKHKGDLEVDHYTSKTQKFSLKRASDTCKMYQFFKLRIWGKTMILKRGKTRVSQLIYTPGLE